MTKHFAKSFVNLSGQALTSQPLAELRFDHRKRRFDVAPFVVVSQEFFTMEIIEVQHASPELRLRAIVGLNLRVRLERDIRDRAALQTRQDVCATEITFVRRNLFYLEAALDRAVHQAFEEPVIMRVTIAHLNGRDDVGFDHLTN